MRSLLQTPCSSPHYELNSPLHDGREEETKWVKRQSQAQPWAGAQKGTTGHSHDLSTAQRGPNSWGQACPTSLTRYQFLQNLGAWGPQWHLCCSSS